MRVFVLLFNAHTENEGIHTIRLAKSDGSERHIVMMFESKDDAERYAMLLEAQDFYVPTVESIDSEEIEAFCQSSGYEAKFLPEGFVPQSPEERVFLSPPETNVDDSDWQSDRKPSETTESDLSNSELDEIRRKLEGLL